MTWSMFAAGLGGAFTGLSQAQKQEAPEWPIDANGFYVNARDAHEAFKAEAWRVQTTAYLPYQGDPPMPVYTPPSRPTPCPSCGANKTEVKHAVRRCAYCGGDR